jgi:hypothetical protein
MMLFRRRQRWLRYGGYIISLDRVYCFSEYNSGVWVCFSCDKEPLRLEGVTLDELEYFLKHGKPRKAGKNK